MADVPWKFRSHTLPNLQNPHGRRDTERHYRTMTMEEIAALPVKDLAHPKGCHLFFWTTGPFLEHAFDIIRAWGWRYSTMGFNWPKLRKAFKVEQLRLLPSMDADFHVGLGHTTRKNGEYCLLARRGSPRREARDVRELILAPVRAHSQKPEEAFSRVERYCVGPYLELFSRTDREGWTSWGDESGTLKG